MLSKDAIELKRNMTLCIFHGMSPNNTNNSKQIAVGKPFQSKSYPLGWGGHILSIFLTLRNEYLELLFQRLAVSDSENFELCAFESEFLSTCICQSWSSETGLRS